MSDRKGLKAIIFKLGNQIKSAVESAVTKALFNVDMEVNSLKEEVNILTKQVLERCKGWRQDWSWSNINVEPTSDFRCGWDEGWGHRSACHSPLMRYTEPGPGARHAESHLRLMVGTCTIQLSFGFLAARTVGGCSSLIMCWKVHILPSLKTWLLVVLSCCGGLVCALDLGTPGCRMAICCWWTSKVLVA